MSVRRVADVKTEMPSNPGFIDFPWSDGDASTWPQNTTREIDNDGCVNFYEYVPIEDPRALRWRLLIGDAVAAKLKLPNGPTYILREWPANYRLFDHHKGRAGDPRHDLYLHGPVKKRFRSVNEFVPHAIWLVQNPSLNPTMSCECKYCSKSKSQKEITAAMSDILRLTPTQSPGPSRSRTTREKPHHKVRDPLSRVKGKQREPPIYASVQRRLKPLKAASNLVKQPMLAERANDLRAVHSKTSMTLRRWFREGEVVWCAIDPPILGNGEGVSISYWPAVIDEVKLKTVPIPRKSTPNPPLETSATVQHIDDDSGKGPILELSGEPLPWSIHQSTKYKVQLLAVSHMLVIEDLQVLPYQAYMPSPELLQEMSHFPLTEITFEREIISKFNPCPGENPPTFRDALAAFAWAIQIASVLSSMWCLTDEYDAQFSLQPLPPSTSPTKPSGTSFLPSGSQPTATNPITGSPLQSSVHMSSHPHYSNVSSIDPSMTQSELQETARHVLGSPTQTTERITQTRFQGLWWGSERIWVDDFIRLKIPRRTMAPGGTEYILAPSGPGAKAASEWSKEGRGDEELGARTRGLFMKLDGLVAVDVPVNDSGDLIKEARAYGTLYELADEDWNDPNEVRQSNPGVVTDLAPAPSTAPNESVSVPNTIATPPQPATNGQHVEHSIPPTSNEQISTSFATPPRKPLSSGGTTSMPLLPPPPLGYKFRAILKPGYESTICLGLVSGRYYPRILSHPALKPVIDAAISQNAILGGFEHMNNLWALEGLSAGFHNSVDPVTYKSSRTAMLQDADCYALELLQDLKQRKVAERQVTEVQNVFTPPVEVQEQMQPMDVDQDDFYV